MNSFNTFHSNINRSNNKIGQMYYRVVSAGLSAMNGAVVRNISGFSANGISPGFYSYTPTNLVGTPLASVDSSPRNFDRSYNVLVIDRITGATTTTTYDVYGGGTPNPTTTLTNYLNSLTPSVIVVIATWDEPQNNVTAGLVSAIKRCGGSSSFPSFINLRGAYLLLGIPDIGEGKGIERYVGGTITNGDPNAAIDLRFTVSDGQYSHINYTNNLVLWYTFDSNTVDGTTVRDLMNNYNGTIEGATFDTVNKTVGTASAAFAGNGNTYIPYIRINTTLPASLTDQNALSFSFWFRSTSNTGDFGRIFDFANGAASDNIIAFVYSGSLGFSVYNATTGGNIYNIANANDNVWRHCVWVLTTSTWRLYINGTLSLTQTTGIYFPRSLVRSINYIGKSNWDNPSYNGNIDDFRIYKEALTPETVSILFSYDRTNYTNNLLLWYKFDSNTISGTTVADYTRNYNGTLQNNATISTTTKRKGTASLYLQTNSNKQYVSIPNYTISSNLSFSFWINPANTTTNNRIFDSGDGTDFDANNIVIYLESGNLGFGYNVNNYNVRNDWYIASGLPVISINTWTHIVITAYNSGSNTIIKVYKNNVLTTINTITPKNANFSAAIPNIQRESNFIGKSNWSSDAAYSGYIDDFRIYNEVLTEDKIDTLYNNYK
jgi:hypothetical protein